MNQKNQPCLQMNLSPKNQQNKLLQNFEIVEVLGKHEL